MCPRRGGSHLYANGREAAWNFQTTIKLATLHQEDTEMPEVDENKPFPTPAVAVRRPERKSLNLEKVDMNKDRVQGDVFVSKGRASTFTSVIPGVEDRDE